jgi:hypothetical protein
MILAPTGTDSSTLKLAANHALNPGQAHAAKGNSVKTALETTLDQTSTLISIGLNNNAPSAP